MSAYYDITEVIEMGKMAGMFFNKTGRILFYVCIIIYLYGDLAIYGAAVAKSLRDSEQLRSCCGFFDFSVRSRHEIYYTLRVESVLWKNGIKHYRLKPMHNLILN